MQPPADLPDLDALSHLEALRVLEAYEPPLAEDVAAGVFLVVTLAFLIEYAVVYLVDMLRDSFDFFGDRSREPTPAQHNQELMTRRAIAIGLAVASVIILRLDLLALGLGNDAWSPLGLCATALVMSAGGWASLEAAARLLRLPLPTRPE